MNNITPIATGFYLPSMVIAIYTGTGPAYLEAHQVGPNGEVLEGKPLDHSTTDKILKDFSETKEKSKRPVGKVPANMLYIDVDQEKYVWTIPEGKRFMHFSNSLNIPNGEAAIPELVFSAIGKNGLKVLAIKPGEERTLCVAPFHNTSEQGGVCLGSAKATLKGNTFQDIINYWETKFFGSEFTHLSNKSPINGNVNTMWKNLIETGEKFDNSLLIESKITLESLLK